MDRASRVRVTGPLAPYASPFREHLLGLKYSPSSAATHLLLMAQLSRWLDATKLVPAELSSEWVEEFLSANRSQGHRFPKSTRGSELLVNFLRGEGIVPERTVAVLTATDELLERFRCYLVRERGLSAGTVVNHVHAARLFLGGLGTEDLGELQELRASDINQFIVDQSRVRSVASTKCLVTGLRSLLCFFHVEGITPGSLVGAVPTVSGWAMTWLPRAVDPALVKRLLASCDRGTIKGRRDYAVLSVLTRLGLRVGEVAALRLDDIDWRRGELVARGKSNRLEPLPLPADVGRALAGYIEHGRPRSEHREVFLRVPAPHRGLTRGAVIVVVRSACARAGIVPIAAHRLRHTVASELLRAGAGLPEIGQLLRQRSMASTAIYTKVDTSKLRTLARPWPRTMP
jgi:integrase/recombinase XerD